jgi:hypothetical protein
MDWGKVIGASIQTQALFATSDWAKSGVAPALCPWEDWAKVTGIIQAQTESLSRAIGSADWAKISGLTASVLTDAVLRLASADNAR